MYSVKEIFYSIQGEGARAGRPSIFLRFAGCNFWTGREEDRKNAICNFCDTDFVGTDGTLGGKYKSPNELIEIIYKTWPNLTRPYIVCTGGEPLLQLDEALIKDLHKSGFEIAVETNGSIELPEGIDWVCMSPKQKDELVVKRGNELKFIYPQSNLNPSDFENLEFEHFFIQPMDGPFLQMNTNLAIEFCLKNPKWHLSIQTHKIIGVR